MTSAGLITLWKVLRAMIYANAAIAEVGSPVEVTVLSNKSSWCVALVAVSCLLLPLTMSAAPTISYIQGNYATPQSAQVSVAVKFNSTQTAGNLNVVVVGWNDSTATVSSVTDSSGNTYQRAIGPTIVSGLLTQSIYFAKNIVSASAGANSVTVLFSSAASFPDVRVVEYNGADLSNPVDVTKAAAGNGGTSNSGSATTTNPTDLIFGTNSVTGSTKGPGTGFTQRLLTVPDGDIVEDRMVAVTGNYSATAAVSGGRWIMQMVAFRTPVVGGGDTQPPTAPTNLTGTAVSSSQMNLSWTASTDNVGVTGYLIERCQGAGCTNFVQVGTSTTTTFNDTGLTGATAYSYRVRATDAAGNFSPYSNTATAPTLATVSGLVAAYSFDEGTGTTVNDLSGNGNTGTVANTTWTSSGKYGNALVFNGTSSRVTVNDSSSLHLTNGMTLEAWVKPSTVSSSWRDVIYKGNDNYFLEGTSSNSSVPAGGGTFGGASGLVVGSSSLTVNTWSHLALTYDGATLRLYVNGVQVSSVAQTGNLLTSTNPLQIGGDSIFGQYFAGTIDEVRVYNTALNQAQIQSDMGIPVGGGVVDTQPPTVPSNLTATAISGTQINLSWTASTDNVGVTGYMVERCQGTGCTNFAQIGTTTTTTFNDTGLTVGTSYSYRARAGDAAGNLSVYSNVASATTQAPDTQPPTTPSSLSATAVSGSQINLSWTASTDNVGVTGYLIERCQRVGCTNLVQVGTSTTTTFNDTGLTGATAYSYRVRATDAAGNFSPYSNTATAPTLATVSGLVAAYSFDEGTGTAVNDLSGMETRERLPTQLGRVLENMATRSSSTGPALGSPRTIRHPCI